MYMPSYRFRHGSPGNQAHNDRFASQLKLALLHDAAVSSRRSTSSRPRTKARYPDACSTTHSTFPKGLGGGKSHQSSVTSSAVKLWLVFEPRRGWPTQIARNRPPLPRSCRECRSEGTAVQSVVIQCYLRQPWGLSCPAWRTPPSTLEAERCQTGPNPLFGRPCSQRGAQQNSRTTSRLRTEPETAPLFRSRALGSMVSASARELWRFFVRFRATAPGADRPLRGAPAPRARARARERGLAGFAFSASLNRLSGSESECILVWSYYVHSNIL